MPVGSIEAAQAWREERQNIAARKPLPVAVAMAVQDEPWSADSDEDFQSARRRREVAEANRAEFAEREERGELIKVSAVKSALASVIASTRDALMQVPARLSPVLAAESDPGRVHDLLQAEIHQALAQFVSAPDRLKGAGT